MATDVERLVVSLEAKMTSYEKAMNRALGITNQRTKQIESRFGQLETRIRGIGANALSGFSKGFLGAAAGALSFTAILNGARTALDKFGVIADRSKAAGVDAEFFQGLAYNAQLAGVDINSVASALEAFNKNAGLATAERGKLLTTLRALNPELAREIQLASSQEERIRAVADAIAAETDASRKAAIASAAFGEQGIKLVGILEQGAVAIDNMVAKAKEIGVVVDRDMIARADEFGDKLDTANLIIETKINKSLVDLAPLMIDLTDKAADFLTMIAIAYDRFKDLGSRTDLPRLQVELGETENKMMLVKERIAEIEAALASGGPNGMILKLDLQDAQAQLAGLTAQANQLLSRVQELQGFKPPTSTPSSAPVPASSPNTGGGSDLDLLGLNLPSPGQLQETSEGVRSIGTAARETAEAVEQINPAFEAMEERLRIGQDLAQSFFSGIINDVLDGESAVDALGRSLDDLARQLIDMALNNAISGLFSGLFGGGGEWNIPSSYVPGGFYPGLPGRAGGGPVSAGRPYIVGEERPELFVPSQSGTIIPRVPNLGGQKVTNNVFNYGNDKVETRPNSTGGIDVIIAAAVAKVEKNMASGRYRPLGVGPGLRRS